jgi:hypothetical protein
VSSFARLAAFGFAIILSAVILSACVTEPTVGPSGAPIALSPASSGELDAYLRKVKVTRPGAFAVSPDGRDTFYTWCDDISCATTDYAGKALRRCQSFSGAPCVVLYVRNQPRILSTRAADAAPGGQHSSEEQQPIDFDTHGRS